MQQFVFLVDEGAYVPHYVLQISDTFLHNLSIIYLCVSNLLLNILFSPLKDHKLYIDHWGTAHENKNKNHAYFRNDTDTAIAEPSIANAIDFDWLYCWGIDLVTKQR